MWHAGDKRWSILRSYTQHAKCACRLLQQTVEWVFLCTQCGDRHTLIYIRVYVCLSDCIYWIRPLPSCRHRHRLCPRQGGQGGWAEATLWRWTRLSWRDAVLPQCKHFPALYYHYCGWCYCYNSHFGKRLSCSDRKAENGQMEKRRRWNSGSEYDLYNIYIYR